MTTYSKRAPNGKTYTVTGPPNASDDEVIAEILRQNPEAAGGPAAAPTQEAAPATRAEARAQGKPRSALNYAGMYTRAGLRGLGGLADMLMTGNPVTGGQKLAMQVTLPKEQYEKWEKENSYADRADRLSNWLGLTKPETGFERVSSAVAEGAAGSIVPGGGAKAVLGGIISGGLAGGTGELVKEKGGTQAQQIAAALAAGIAPTALLSGGKQAISKGMSYLGAPDERAAQVLKSRALDPDEAARAIGQSRRAEPVTGVSPTTAEVAMDPGLAAFQRSRPSPAIWQQETLNQQARQRAAQEIMGEGDPTVIQNISRGRVQEGADELARREVQGNLAMQQREEAAEAAKQARIEEGAGALAARQARGEEQLGIVTERAGQRLSRVEERAARELEKRTAAIGPEVSREVSGTGIRGTFKEAYEAAKETTRKAYNARVLTRPRKVDMPAETAVKLYDDIRKRAMTYYDMPFETAPGTPMGQIVSMFDGWGKGTLTNRNFASIDRKLADFAGEAKRAGRLNDASFAQELRDVVGKASDPYISDAFKVALAKAKGARREQAQLFEEGRLGNVGVTATERSGAFATPDVELARQIVTKGDPGATLGKQLISSVGRKKAREIVAEEMRRLADEGVLSTPSAPRSYGPVLTEFPEVGKRVAARRAQEAANKARIAEQQAAGKAAVSEQGAANRAAILEQEATNRANVATQEALNRANIARQRTLNEASLAEQAGLNKEFANTALGRTAGKGVDATAFIRDALGRNDGGLRFRELTAQIKATGNEDAMNGLRKALGDHASKAGGPLNLDEAGAAIPSVDQTYKAVTEILDVGGDALTPVQHNVLGQIQAELGSANYANKAGKLRLEEYGSKSIPFATGKVANTIRFFIGNLHNEGRLHDLIDFALRNPKRAEELLKRASPDRIRKLKRAIGRATVGAGAATAEAQMSE